MTYNPKSEFLQEMLSRGFLQDCTDMQGLDEKLLEGCMPAYIGFDATADSLHIGSLIQIMMLRWLQKTGHKPIPLMGGGTTKIGDPSGKDESRQLITTEIINENINGIQKVFEKYLSFGDNSNDAKIKILKVNKNIINKYGAVSKECCKSMVQNLSKISKSNINVSITGVAGPGGASKDKPVGLVYIGIKMGKYLLILKKKFKSKNRNSIQKSTVQKVIKIILNLI